MNPEEWLDKVAIAKFATGEMNRYGRVVGYNDAPTFILEEANGQQFSWSADLCVLSPESEAIAYWKHRAEIAEAKLLRAREGPFGVQCAPYRSEGP